MLSRRIKHRQRSETKRLSPKEAKLLAALERDISLRRRKVMQPSGKELPRLSGALRAFGGLTSDASCDPVCIDETLVRKKQKKKTTITPTEKSWEQVSEDVTLQCSKQDAPKVSRLIVCIN